MLTKPWYLSVTIWASLFSGLVMVAKQQGWDIPGDPNGWATDVVGLVTTALAIYGRVRAVHKLTS